MQLRHFGQRRNQGIGQPGRQVVLGGIAGKIAERQNRQARLAGVAGVGIDLGNGPDRLGGHREPVAAAGQCLDEPGIHGRILQALPEPLDGGIDAVVEIDEAIRPQTAADLFPGHHLARVLGQQRKKAEELLGKPDGQAVLAQFSRALIEFKIAGNGLHTDCGILTSKFTPCPGEVSTLIHGSQSACYSAFAVLLQRIAARPAQRAR